MIPVILSAVLVTLIAAPVYQAWRDRGYPTLEEL